MIENKVFSKATTLSEEQDLQPTLFNCIFTIMIDKYIRHLVAHGFLLQALCFTNSEINRLGQCGHRISGCPLVELKYFTIMPRIQRPYRPRTIDDDEENEDVNILPELVAAFDENDL